MKKVFVLILAFGLLNSGVAQAFDWFGGRLSIGGGYGYDKPKLPYAFQDQYKEAKCFFLYQGKRKMREGNIEIIPIETALKNLPQLLS